MTSLSKRNLNVKYKLTAASRIFSSFQGFTVYQTQLTTPDITLNVMKAYIVVRTQSSKPEKPILTVDYLPLTGTGVVERVNNATHAWDDSDPLITPGGRDIKLGAGIPRNHYSSVTVRDQGWEEDLEDMRELLLEHVLEEVKGSMTVKKVLMEWTPRSRDVHESVHVREGDSDHYWWEIRTVEVGIEGKGDGPARNPPGGSSYR